MKKWLPLLFLTGCNIGPHYYPPETVIAETWDDNPVVTTWWEQFNDPTLSQLIAKTKESNYNLIAAEANILKARALRQVSASSLFPQVTSDVNDTKTYFSKNGPVFAIGPASGNNAGTSSPLTGVPFAVQVPQVQNLFNALFDATWELDLFGKTRRSVEAADARIGSAIEQRNDLLITLFAETSRTYMEMRSFQTKKKLQEENIALSRKNLFLLQKEWEVGYVNLLDLKTAEGNLAAAEAKLPDTLAEIYRSIYALSVLTGQMPEDLVDELFVEAPLPKPPANLALGLRSDLLRRRPDIRQAERDLAAATATVGIAVASFFPSVSLLGLGGFQSLKLPELLNWSSRTWAYGTDVSMPVYQGGKLVGNLHFAQSDQALAAANYHQTVLSALQEAESSLIVYKETQQKAASEHDLVISRQMLVDLTECQFKRGLVNEHRLIDQVQDLITAQLSALESDTSLLLSMIALYKSLGGGWE